MSDDGVAACHLPLRERRPADVRSAMKTRHHIAVATLRSRLAARNNAGAVEPPASMLPSLGAAGDVPRRVLTEAQVHAVITGASVRHRDVRTAGAAPIH